MKNLQYSCLYASLVEVSLYILFIVYTSKSLYFPIYLRMNIVIYTYIHSG